MMTDQPGVRASILAEAADLIGGDRRATYGDASESFARIGQVWGAILGSEPIRADLVALMMAGLKIMRAVSSPGHRDSYVDLAGYAGLAGEIARPADDTRTTTERQAEVIRFHTDADRPPEERH